MKSVESLINALNDSDWQVRQRAAKALGKRGDKQAVQPLIQVLKDEDEWVRAGSQYNWARAEAAAALGQLGDVRAIGPLIEALKDSQENVCLGAIQGLSNFRDPRIVEAFIEMLKGWENFWDYRREQMLLNIAGFLGKMGDKRAIDPLIKSLNYSNDFRCGFAICNDARENGGCVPIFAGLKVNETRLAVVEALIDILTGLKPR